MLSLTIWYSLLCTQTPKPRIKTEDPNHTSLNALALSYQANREAFRFGTFRFEYTRGSSESNEQALAGRFSHAYTGRGLYVFDGKNSRYEVIHSVDDMAKTTQRISNTETKTLLSPIRMLCDGEVTLMDFLDVRDSSLNSNIMIHQGVQYFSRHFEFPVSIGQDNPVRTDLNRAIKSLAEGNGVVKEIDFHARLDAIDVCKIVLDFKTGEGTYWVDMNRGAIPLRLAYTRNSDVTHVYTNNDLKFIANAGWLPMTLRVTLQDGKVAWEIRITDVDVNEKPGISMFQLDFPSAIELYDDARKLTYGPRTKWSLLELPTRGSRDATPTVPHLFVQPSEMPGEASPSRLWPIAFLASGVVLFIVVSFRILLRRRHKSRGA